MDFEDSLKAYLPARLETESRKLVVSAKSGITTLDLNSITHIKGTGKIQTANFADGRTPVDIKLTMQELEQKLADAGFIRVHRAFLVNYRYIAAIRDNMITLSSGGEIPLSRRVGRDVKEKYLEIMRGANSTFF